MKSTIQQFSNVKWHKAKI